MFDKRFIHSRRDLCREQAHNYLLREDMYTRFFDLGDIMLKMAWILNGTDFRYRFRSRVVVLLCSFMVVFVADGYTQITKRPGTGLGSIHWASDCSLGQVVLEFDQNSETVNSMQFRRKLPDHDWEPAEVIPVENLSSDRDVSLFYAQRGGVSAWETYYLNPSGDVERYERPEGGTWTRTHSSLIRLCDSWECDRAERPLMATDMDCNDTIHMAFLAENCLYYLKFDGTTSTPSEIVTTFDRRTFMAAFDSPHQFSPPRNLSIAVGTDGTVHIVYSVDQSTTSVPGGTEEKSKLFYSHKEKTGEWVRETLIDHGSASDDAGLGASMDIAPDGTIAVAATYLPRAYTGSPGVAQLRYLVKSETGTWNSSIISSAASGYRSRDGQRGTGLYPFLKFDNFSRPHIVFTDHASEHTTFTAYSYSGQMRYATRPSAASGGWTLETLVSQPTGDAFLRRLDNPVLAVSGSACGNRVAFYGDRLEKTDGTAQSPPSKTYYPEFLVKKIPAGAGQPLPFCQGDQVSPGTDLQVESIIATQAPGSDKVDFKVKIINPGTRAASSFSLGFWIHRDETPTLTEKALYSFTCPGLAASGRDTISFSHQFDTTGNFTAHAYVDHGSSRVDELDEKNNTKKTSYTVVPAIKWTAVIQPGYSGICDRNNTVSKLLTALKAKGFAPVFMDQIPQVLEPSVFKAVFIMLGYYNTCSYELTLADSAVLSDYLDRGGNLYMEGGDTWNYDPNRPIHPYFGIYNNWARDGGDTLNRLEHLDGKISFHSEGYATSVDELIAVQGPGIEPIWQSHPDDSSPYICGITRNGEGFKTIGTSFEFGNIPETAQLSVITSYLTFFGLLPKDLNGDEKIDLTDLILSLKILAGESVGSILDVGDINKDNKTGSPEGIYILRELGRYTGYYS